MEAVKQRKLPYVWEIDYHGVKSHAIGTHHQIPAVFGDDIQDKLKGKENLLLEVIDEELTTAVMNQWMRLLYSPLMNFLEGFSEEDIGFLAKIFKIGVDEVKNMRLGWFEHGLLCACGYENLSSLESQLEECTDKKLISVIPLESPEEPLPLFADKELVIYEGLARQLITLETEEEGSAHAYVQRTFIENYLDGRSEELAYTLAKLAKNPVKFIELNVERQKKMASKALKHLEKPCLIAVGTAHYFIEPSLITLLSEKGASIRRV